MLSATAPATAPHLYAYPDKGGACCLYRQAKGVAGAPFGQRKSDCQKGMRQGDAARALTSAMAMVVAACADAGAKAPLRKSIVSNATNRILVSALEEFNVGGTGFGVLLAIGSRIPRLATAREGLDMDGVPSKAAVAVYCGELSIIINLAVSSTPKARAPSWLRSVAGGPYGGHPEFASAVAPMIPPGPTEDLIASFKAWAAEGSAKPPTGMKRRRSAIRERSPGVHHRLWVALCAMVPHIPDRESWLTAAVGLIMTEMVPEGGDRAAIPEPDAALILGLLDGEIPYALPLADDLDKHTAAGKRAAASMGINPDLHFALWGARVTGSETLPDHLQVLHAAYVAQAVLQGSYE